jgi:hypothetical protein
VSGGRWAGEKVLAVLLGVVVWCVIDVTQKEEENLITSETGKRQNTQRQADPADGSEHRDEGRGPRAGRGGARQIGCWRGPVSGGHGPTSKQECRW